MKRMLFGLTAAALLLPSPGSAGIYPPAPGIDIPQTYYDRIARDETAFEFRHAWLDKTRRIKHNREQYIFERGFYNRELISAEAKPELSVTGTLSVPVFMVKFANSGADPYPISTMQTKLFDGPYSPQTLTQFYNEISYGDLNMTGTVYGWHQLPNNDTYYEAGCNGLCGSSQVGSLITNTLTAYDAVIDFGQYDNDGPDGVPNSGDDDGYVDVAAFIQPESGGECGNTNIWSHRWRVSGWTGSPFNTNDPRTGGGVIQVEDYTIQPALNCDSTTAIDIGVFCHEFGHAFGLPDLYDANGGSQGIGHWGLMGSGNWNIPTLPAHMSAWSKTELGWSNVVKVDGKKTTYNIANAEQNRTIYQLDVPDERWRRQSSCVIGGVFSMRCGLTAAEGANRNWAGGEGYGNGWDETIYHDFSYDGTAGVSFVYGYTYYSEPGKDITSVRIDVGGTVSTLATYSGASGSGAGFHDLTPYLLGSGVSTYRILFEFQSDNQGSDEDGNFPSFCGPFVFDNVTVFGGGENYFTDFEVREDGWCVDMSSPAEYFLVENRQPILSDVNVHGGGGLAIWHINNDVAHSRWGNSGGSSNLLPHGSALEQADGLDDLGANTNRGDGGDPFPGLTNNTAFTNATVPSSLSENLSANNVCVINIGVNPADGSPIAADMSAGYLPPTYSSNVPVSGPTDSVVDVSIYGADIACAATAFLQHGATIVNPTTTTWMGKDLLVAEFDLTGVAPDVYDLVIANPVNSCTVVPSAFTVDAEVPTALQRFAGKQVGSTVELAWETADAADVLGWRVYRRAGVDERFEKVSASMLPAWKRSFSDADIASGTVYNYRLNWVTSEGESRAGDVKVKTKTLSFALGQNYPNPFNPSTVIPFELAETRPTTLRVYNLLGQVVRTLVDGVTEAGAYTIEWDGRNDRGQTVTSGVYFYKLQSGTFSDVRKLIMMK